MSRKRWRGSPRAVTLVGVDQVLAYAALAVLPAGAFWGAASLLDRFTRSHTRPAPPAARRSAQRSAERLVADLGRLSAEHRQVHAGDGPGRAARLRTLALAYDDVLCAGCEALGVALPGRAPLSASARLQAEAALCARGLRW